VFAVGIDGETHRASRQTRTAAAPGGGIRRMDPPQHEYLWRKIAERDLIARAGTTSTRRVQVCRHRIPTGLARGTVIAETVERSGSLLAGRRAAKSWLGRAHRSTRAPRGPTA